MRTVGLRSRRRIGILAGILEPKPVAGSRGRRWNEAGEIAARFGCEPMQTIARAGQGVTCRSAHEGQGDLMGCRRPDAEVHAASRLHFCADREPASNVDRDWGG